MEDTGQPIEQPMPQVRIGARYDERDVPYVRLTRTVQSGFGLGVGIALAQIVIVGGFILLMLVLGVVG